MNLVVDIGNSKVKMCLFDNGEIIKQGLETVSSIQSILKFCGDYSIEKMIISDVTDTATELWSHFKSIINTCIILNDSTKIPLENRYETPQTLGYDRIAAAVGAQELFPNQNCVIIDAGTAITIDFINQRNQFIGGNISPGLNTRFKSLHNYTNKLPLLESKETWSMLGNNTRNAIISGVQQGIVFELDGYIDYFKTQYGTISVVLTGGDAELFTKNIKSQVTIEPYLIFKGLNRIVDYNATNK
jgi:type III pantothenate kinase